MFCNSETASQQQYVAVAEYLIQSCKTLTIFFKNLSNQGDFVKMKDKKILIRPFFL